MAVMRYPQGMCKSLDKPLGDSSRSNKYPKPASAGCILAAEGRLRVCVAAVSTARARSPSIPCLS